MIATIAAALLAQTATPLDVYKVDPVIDGVTVGASAVAIVVPYALTSVIVTPRCPCDPRLVNAFDRPAIGLHSDIAAVASNVELGLAIGVPLLLDTVDLGWSRPLLDDTVVFAETLTVDAALTTLVKFAYQRPEPLVYAGLGSSRDLYDSFFSGHVALAAGALAAASMTYSLRYGPAWWPWLATVTIAGSVAIERVAAGVHFPTDVIAGFAAGAAVGIAVPYLHVATRERATLVVTPTSGGAVAGIRVQI